MTREDIEIGSIWKARDGRIMQVERFSNRGSGDVAVCLVINAGYKIRRITQINVRANFGSFLLPHSEK